MKPQREIKPAGIAVSHCDVLLRQGAKDVDLMPEFGRLGERLARALTTALFPFCSGLPEVRLSAATRMTGGELAGRILPLAANSLLSPKNAPHRAVLSIEGAAVLAQLDRALGGSGDVVGDLPKMLPLSADMFARRIECAVGEALGRLIEHDGPLSTSERDGSYSALTPFRKADALAVLSFEVADGGAKPWSMMLATRAEHLPAFVNTARSPGPRQPRKQGPFADPFASVPLTLEAVLAEMRIPISRLATLEPGQTLAIPVARAVPLRVGGTIVAKGTVGELEDRVALQLTSSMFARKDPQ